MYAKGGKARINFCMFFNFVVITTELPDSGACMYVVFFVVKNRIFKYGEFLHSENVETKQNMILYNIDDDIWFCHLYNYYNLVHFATDIDFNLATDTTR